MQQKKSINLGFRGWMLVIYQAIGFLTFTAFTNWPLNILADLYGGSNQISMLYTVGILIAIVIQLVMNRFVGKLKSIKKLSMLCGGISLLGALGIMLLPPSQLLLWKVCYFLVCVFTNMYACFSIGILVGQWFPRRKGTVMGIATFAFPLANGMLGAFAGMVFKPNAAPDVFGAFLPFFIICLIGYLVGAIFIKDYPEQCGAYRDNDKSFAPEAAKAMMEQEIQNKMTTVWTLGNTIKCKDFWFVTIPMGALLMCSVGMMTQTNSIIGHYPQLPFGGVMALIMVVACFGSWLLGVLDTKFGTKKAVLIAVIFMLISGILGSIANVGCLVASLVCLAVFMGAGSNFTVSAAAQYWRREDFPSVFAVVNPLANVLQAIGPMVIAISLNTMGYTAAFGVTTVIAVISFVLILLFKPERVKARDDKYRVAAGKALDDALADRK